MQWYALALGLKLVLHTSCTHNTRAKRAYSDIGYTPSFAPRETYSLAGWPRSAPAREREVEVGGLRLRSGNGPPRSAQVSFSSSPSGFTLLHRPARALRPADRSLPFPSSSRALAAHCCHGSPPERPAEEILIRFLCRHAHLLHFHLLLCEIRDLVAMRSRISECFAARFPPSVDFATWDFARKEKKKGNGKMETALARRATH